MNSQKNYKSIHKQENSPEDGTIHAMVHIAADLRARKQSCRAK